MADTTGPKPGWARRWAGFGRTGIWILLAAVFSGLWPAAPMASAAPLVQRVTRVDALLAPDSGAKVCFQLDRFCAAVTEPGPAPEAAPALELGRRWDRRFPARGGRATYEVDLPARPADGPQALLFYRVGNQAEVRLNGVELQRWGTLGVPVHDAAKVAHLVNLPASLLRVDGPNRLQVQVTVQAQRWGGLSPFDVGPQAEISARYAFNRLWRQQALLVFAVGLALMGGLAGALWLRQRDPLFGCFALAAGFGVVRHVDRLWADVPVPWPAWGALVAAAYAVHLGQMARFAVMAVGGARPALLRGIDGATAVAVVLALAAFGGGLPWAWTTGLALMQAVGVLALVHVAWHSWQDGSLLRWALVGVGLLTVAAGLHDLGAVRFGWAGDPSISLTPHAIFLFVLVMAGLVADRYSSAVQRQQQLSDSLAQRVAERESELRQVYETLREQQMNQAVADERQRLMRDIHDGVGAHLVGLVSLASRGSTAQPALAEQARLALDELHMAVDALAPVDGDLAVVLGTLRYRLQSRLQAAGLEIEWDVEPLPALPGLRPANVAQLQRIVLEAITNVVKHAQASRLQLRAWAEPAANGQPAQVCLLLADNGRGFDVEQAPRGGHGLTNLRSRATAIGAELQWDSRPGAGTTLRLVWPLAEAG